MPAHAQTRVLPFTPEQMFDLVAAIERYPEFLPWCTGARILGRDGNVVTADLVIGYGPLHERYTSRVTLDRPRRIDVGYLHGPFRRLENRWEFLPHASGCTVNFRIDFAFRSRLLDAMMGAVFRRSFHRMVQSFEGRAGRVYGAAPDHSTA